MLVLINKLKEEKKKTQCRIAFFFLFFFMRSGSCLEVWLFRGGVFGLWIAGKCDRNECGIVRYPDGIPHLHESSLWRPAAEFSLHLMAPYLYGKTEWIKNNWITGFHLCFHFPGMQKENERKGGKKMNERKGRKTCERNYSKTEECLIHSGCEGRVQSQMCVFLW